MVLEWTESLSPLGEVSGWPAFSFVGADMIDVAALSRLSPLEDKRIKSQRKQLKDGWESMYSLGRV